MEQPLTFEMDHTTRKNIRETRIKPPYCRYPVIGIPWQIIPYPYCEIAWQGTGYLGTHIHLGEINAKKDVLLKFTVRRPMVFLIFLLEGTITFRNWQGQVVSLAKARTFYMTYSPLHTFSYSMLRGKHTIMVAALERDWLLPTRARYPGFTRLLESWQKEKKTMVILPRCAIGQRVNRLLESIRTSPVKSLEGGIEISRLLMDCINIYHELVTARQQAPDRLPVIQAKMLREYLHRHYTSNARCRMKRIAQDLQLSPWQVREIARKYFGMSVHDYVVKLRMERARQLLLNTRRKISEIGYAVGFSEAASFTRTFKKYHGKRPKDIRKNSSKTP